MLLAHLAYLREKELYDSGRRSFHPVESARAEMVPQPSKGFMEINRIDAYYRKARAAAVKRETAWISYQDQRFAKGMHPDTHPDFWDDWKEPEYPRLPGASLLQLAVKNGSTTLIVAVVFIAMACWGVQALWRKVSLG